MRKPRGPAWWYELRYGTGYHLAIACCAAALVVIGLAASGLPGWLADRVDAVEADCRARGGFMDHGAMPKSGVAHICKGARP